VITPERSGLCGAYSWLDGRAAYEIIPTGPNQPIAKGNVIDEKLGQWEKVNEFIKSASQGKIEKMSAYSMVSDPMTSCGCFECISALLPSTNGIMIVNREFSEMTPCGMKFSTLAGTVGGGNQVPGFVGHSKHYITSRKKEALAQRAQEIGLEPEKFISSIADEKTASSEEEVLEFISKNEHPAIALEAMF
jgi:acetyl-CoA synthase